MKVAIGIIWTMMILGIGVLSFLHRISKNEHKERTVHAVVMFASIYFGMTIYFVTQNLLMSMGIASGIGLLLPFFFRYPNSERIIHSSMHAVMGGMMGGMLSGMLPVAEWNTLFKVMTLCTFTFGMLVIYDLHVSHPLIRWVYNPFSIAILMLVLGVFIQFLPISSVGIEHSHNH
ncbi:hypothetical protein N780_00620 [Pontibacillus chungwhensis BH030062]|uniref:DUF5134 domain-containing protein n=1 Tax=Pontibacillus chungwhensis BH030062 TaxID=1385513 RepID=A0A0A2V0R2_9BACI|nr:hypothetical protein [Pontibacillus chungwhensis]KGP92351.1 hypothetical protein N780_00620 [Pontibacillus chungwhensis BH030062]